MEEDICKQYMEQWANTQIIQRTLTTQYQKEDWFKNGLKRWMIVFPKNRYKWPAQAHEKMLDIKQASGNSKSKLQWDIMSHLWEWLSSKWQPIKSVGEAVEEREPSYTVGMNANWFNH